MKRSKLTWFLLAFALMLVYPATVKTSIKSKPTTDWTLYYWFDADNNYLMRQSTVDDEIALTGLDESLQNPKTLQEKGWAPAAVIIIGEFEIPLPITLVPTKKLYSHP